MRLERDFYAKACALQGLRRYDEALGLLGRALAEHPDDARLHAARSRSLRHLKRHEEALEAADTAISCDPLLPEGHVARAWALLQMTDGGAQALLEAQEALRLAPMSGPALEVLATACVSCGDAAGAEQVARAVLAVAPGSVLGLFVLGTAAMLREDWEQAREHLLAVVGRDPESVGAMVNLAICAGHAGRREEATDWWQQVARLDPGDDRAARRVARSVAAAAAGRLFDGRPKGEALALLRAEVATPDPGRPAFVQGMLVSVLASKLLNWHEGDATANVLEAVGLVESLAAVDPDAPVDPPAGAAGGSDPALAPELHAAAWLGGADYRREVHLGWLQDGAEANLIAVPVAGDRLLRVSRALQMADACLDLVEESGQWFAKARVHMTAGRAELMRVDGVRQDNVARSVGHFRSALEVYTRLRVMATRPTAEKFLGNALLGLDPDPAGEVLGAALTHLGNARQAFAARGAKQPLAVAEASLGDAHYKRLQVCGDPSDATAAVAHLRQASTLFGEVGQRVGQAHFLCYESRVLVMRPDGDPAENRALALRAMQEAAGLVTREGAAIRWGMVQADTADVLRREPSAEARTRAVDLARVAVEVPDRRTDPKDWATSTRVLALALAARAEQRSGADPAADAAEAVALVRAAFPELDAQWTRAFVAELHAEVAEVLRIAAEVTGEARLLDEAAEQVRRGLELAESRGYVRPAALLRQQSRRLEASRG